MMKSIRFLSLPLAALGPTVAVSAQTLPGLENFSIEQPRRPAPVTTPTPVPSASPTPTPSTLTPSTSTPSSTPAATPSVTPSPRATAPSPASPRPTPRATTSDRAPAPTPPATSETLPASPVAAPDLSPQPQPTPTAAPSVAPPAVVVSSGSWWAWLLAGGAAIGLAGFGWSRRRRRQAADNALWAEPPAAAEPVPPPPPPPVASPAASAAAPAAPPVSGSLVTTAPPAAPRVPGGLITTALRPAIAFELQPVRAGVDSLRVTLDYVLIMSNAGRAVAHDVAVESWLFAAGGNPQAELDQLFAQPLGQPHLAPFALPASAAADLTGQAVAQRELLATITLGERRMVVPMLAVRAHYRDGRGQPAVAGAAFMVGVERDGQERLAPLALDRGARAYDRLAARRFGD